ncbi:MAG: threonine synthase [Clostridia bacterium]|nr:threonine synthase [Clostridia bacterium]
MEYQSTRNAAVRVTATQAILNGISPDGGLYVPAELPALSRREIEQLAGQTYAQRARTVLRLFLTDFSDEELDSCIRAAYPGRFAEETVAPVRTLADGTHMLELWHGPTSAFKDLALQILPHLMRVSAAHAADGQEIVVLVATSGDTGKAALEGFRDAPHTRIAVFYPENGVSHMQKRQMITQEGDNVTVCAVRGNFDTAQTAVKKIFTDADVRALLAKHHCRFSSANSINWGRLVPQIVYYFSAYADLLAQGRITMGDKINVVVPTGNFGNILAAYYAYRMGLPVNRFICASNRNRVLTDFFRTGCYDRNRDFYLTSSPSMDILISSNVERLLFELCGRDDATVRDWMEQLRTNGRYTVSQPVLEKMTEVFYGGTCNDEQTAQTIREQFEKNRYLCDTHTAVALNVYQQYKNDTGDQTPCVVASTASAYKFPASVLQAIGVEPAGDDFEQLDQLAAVSGQPIPAPLRALRTKQPRFTAVKDEAEMCPFVLQSLGISGKE